jgi:NADH dehydrogenase [ubiquinone] 1 alpha subcomplex assembly factor 6
MRSLYVQHSSNLGRKFDLPSYLLTGYIPKRAQNAFIALHTFNIEISRVGDSTSHEPVALMRLQFWRDAVTNALAGAPPKEPSAILLAKAHEDLIRQTNGKSKLSKAWLRRMVKAREQYLGNRPFPTLAALESYAEHTYSTMLYLAMSALPLTSVTADHLASHIGKAAGIAAVLRGVPLIAFPPQVSTHHTSVAKGGPLDSAPQGAIVLPLDVMAECNVREEQVLRHGPAAPNIKDAVFTVATRANDHLITAREMLQSLRQGKGVGHEYEYASADSLVNLITDVSRVDKEMSEATRAFPMLMTAVGVASWLEKLQRHDFDIFNPEIRTTHWKLPWSLYLANLRQRF